MAREQPIPGHNNHFAILERHLESGQYEVVACGADGPTVEDIDAFASDAGVDLPFDFVDFSVSRIGGLYLAVKEDLWPRPQAFDVGPFWSMLYGLYVYGFSRDTPEFMSIRHQTPVFRQHSGTNLVPCLKVICDPDLYGFDPGGVVCRWDHETGECSQVEKTFLEILEFEVAELVKRKVMKLQERAAK